MMKMTNKQVLESLAEQYEDIDVIHVLKYMRPSQAFDIYLDDDSDKWEEEATAVVMDFCMGDLEC